jgi:hypothetical protein
MGWGWSGARQPVRDACVEGPPGRAVLRRARLPRRQARGPGGDSTSRQGDGRRLGISKGAEFLAGSGPEWHTDERRRPQMVRACPALRCGRVPDHQTATTGYEQGRGPRHAVPAAFVRSSPEKGP